MAKKETKEKNSKKNKIDEILDRMQDFADNLVRTKKLEQRIDRLVEAIDKCKRVKGI